MSPRGRPSRTAIHQRLAFEVGELRASLMRFILPAVAGPAKLIPLEVLATRDLSVVALRNAAQRGRLRAVRTPAGTWRSSKQWVDTYRASRYAALRERGRRTALSPQVADHADAG